MLRYILTRVISQDGVFGVKEKNIFFMIEELIFNIIFNY